MHIILWIVGQIIINDKRKLLDIEASSRNISRNQNRHRAFFKVCKRRHAFRLGPVTVNGLGSNLFIL